MRSEKNENSNNDIIYISWAALVAVLLLILIYLCFYLKSVPDYYGYYLLFSLAATLSIGGFYLLFKYGEIKRCSPLDGWLFAGTIIPIIIFLFITWIFYPEPPLLLFFFGVPSCCMQLLFYRVIRPKFVKILPLLCTIAFGCWQFFIYKNPICIEYQLPALCCIIVWLVCRKRN